jgi:hypothetical protein
MCPRLPQFGVSVSHLLRKRSHEFVEESLVGAELLAVANRPANDSAQYVTAPFVTGENAVDDQECAGPDVIRNDVQRTRAIVLDAYGSRGRIDQPGEKIDLVIAVDALHHGRHALESHAGVDRGLWEWLQAAVR